MVTIIDYGMGNLGSVLNMFKRIGAPAQISNDLDVIAKAKKILLPGVGAFDAAMERIENAGLLPVLNYKAKEEQVPVLGICLGMQLLTQSSEEGTRAGLGWVDAKTIRFAFSDSMLKVPHMGWNLVHVKNTDRLVDDLPQASRFYFVHSYHVHCNRQEDVLMTTNYGISFHSIIHHNNIYGAQFHPEKSHKYGMKFLANFANL